MTDIHTITLNISQNSFTNMIDKNPFINSTECVKLTKRKFELAKTILMFPIAIIRILLLILFLLLITGSLLLFTAGYNVRDDKDNLQDMSKCRRYLLFLTQFFSRCCLLILGYWWIEETYPENTPNVTFPSFLERKNAPKLFVGNHVSFIDGLYILSRCIPSVIAQANTVKIPIAGSAISSLSPILVPVTDKQRETLKDPKIQLLERTKSDAFNRAVMIFPEGATTQANTLIKFQNGAFEPLVSVQPVVFKYKYKNVDPSWTGDVSAGWLLFRLCCQFVNKLEVAYCSPVQPDSNDVQEFKTKVIEEMKKVKQFEVSPLTVSDNHFLKRFTHLDIQFNNYTKQASCIQYICNNIYNVKQNGIYIKTIGISEYKQMLKYNDISFSNNEMESFIKKFCDLDTCRTGIITSEQLKMMIKNVALATYIASIMVSFTNGITFFDIVNFICDVKNEKNIDIQKLNECFESDIGINLYDKIKKAFTA